MTRKPCPRRGADQLLEDGDMAGSASHPERNRAAAGTEILGPYFRSLAASIPLTILIVSTLTRVTRIRRLIAFSLWAAKR